MNNNINNLTSMTLNMNDVDDKCTIYVGNIAFEAPDQMFIDEVRRVMAPYLHDTTFKVKIMKKGMSRYAFVMFQTPEIADLAKRVINGHNILGKCLRVGSKVRCTDTTPPPQSFPPQQQQQPQQGLYHQQQYPPNVNRMYYGNPNGNNGNIINNNANPYHYYGHHNHNHNHQQQQQQQQQLYQMQGPQSQMYQQLQQMQMQTPVYSIIENQRQYMLSGQPPPSSSPLPQQFSVTQAAGTTTPSSSSNPSAIPQNNSIQTKIAAPNNGELRRASSPKVTVEIEEERLKRDAPSSAVSPPPSVSVTPPSPSSSSSSSSGTLSKMDNDVGLEGVIEKKKMKRIEAAGEDEEVSFEMFRTPLKRELYNVPVVVQGYTVEALRAMIANVKSLTQKNPKLVKELFTANPQLAYAVLYGLNLIGDLSFPEMEAMIRPDSSIAMSEIVPPPPPSIPQPPKIN